MKAARVPITLLHVPAILMAIVVLGFAYCQRPAAAKSATQPWGVLRSLYLGEKIDAARGLFLRAEHSVQRVSRTAPRQTIWEIRWVKDDEELTVVTENGTIASARETRKLRDEQGRIQQWDWQAISRTQPWLESGEL